MPGHPVLFFLFTLTIMGLASMVGTWFRKRYPDSVERDSSSFKTLEAPGNAQMRELLRQYVSVRLQWVADAGSDEKTRTDLDRGSALQNQMWAIVNEAAAKHRDSVTSQMIATLNESFDNAEKRTAAYENRIPAMAWVILIFIGGVSSFIVGIGVKSRAKLLLALLPLIVASVLMLIRDLDSPQRGFIHIQQQSMVRVARQVGASAP